MGDPVRAVTDTHPLVFHAAGGGRLGPRAAALFERCERREATLYVPAAVIWECALIARVGRINLRRSLRAFFDDLFSNPAYQRSISRRNRSWRLPNCRSPATRSTHSSSPRQ